MSGADIAVALVTGLTAGAFAGAMGVGGGVIMVPVLVELLGASQRRAQGTSLAAIIVTALVGSVVAHRAGLLNLRAASWVALGGLGGALVGSLAATTAIDENLLRRGFGVIVLLTAARIISSSVRAMRATAPTP